MDMEKRLYRVNFAFSYYVTRPCARRLVPVAVKVGISPNQVTAGSLIILIAGMAALSFGGYWSRVAGAVLVLLSYFLDCVDGELARATGKTSKRGEYLDGIGGYLQAAFLLPCIGLGLFRSADAGRALFETVVNVPAWGYAVIGLWAGLVLLLCKLVNLRHRHVFGTSIRRGGRGLFRFATIPHGLLMPLVLIGATFQFLSFVLVAYAAYHSAELFFGLYKAFTARVT